MTFTLFSESPLLSRNIKICGIIWQVAMSLRTFDSRLEWEKSARRPREEGALWRWRSCSRPETPSRPGQCPACEVPAPLAPWHLRPDPRLLVALLGCFCWKKCFFFIHLKDDDSLSRFWNELIKTVLWRCKMEQHRFPVSISIT